MPPGGDSPGPFAPRRVPRPALLPEVRSFLRTAHARVAVVFFAVLYLLGSLLAGGMLTFFPLGGGTTIEILTGSGGSGNVYTFLTGSGAGPGWWNYPGLLVLAPWGVLSLPLFATIAMIVVAVGVGYGMAVAAVLLFRLFRPRREELARTKAVGAATGLTPAMISLVTLGSCCSTTAAATAGVGLIADATGTTVANLLLNNWVLGVAQMVIVWVALIGQELLLRVYGGLLGVAPTAVAEPETPAPAVRRGRSAEERAPTAEVRGTGAAGPELP